MTPSRIAIHEAAHAVTAEVLSPGCVEYVDMAPAPSSYEEWAPSLGLAHVDAYVRWDSFFMGQSEFAAVVYASKWAEIEIGADWKAHCRGDLNAARIHVHRFFRPSASRRAKKIVKEHWDEILALAEELDKWPMLFGPSIREAIQRASA